MESERAFLNLRNLQSLKKINGNQEIKKNCTGPRNFDIFETLKFVTLEIKFRVTCVQSNLF